MSTKEFWEEEPELLWAYRKSYMDKKKIENEIMNYQAWLQGLYIFDAVSKSIYNCFGRKKGTKTLMYQEQPFDFNKKEKTEEEKKKEQILALEEKIRARNIIAKAFLERSGG